MNQEEPLQEEGAEGVEVPETSEETSSESEGGGKKSQIIKIAIITVVILVQAVSAHFIVKKVFFSSPAKPKVKPREVEPIGEVYQLTGIIVNPTGTSGSQHLLVDIGLEVKSTKTIEELGRLEPQIRDNLITFLAAQNVKVLTDISMRDRIRDKVKEIVNFYLRSGQVEKVFFIRYVFQ